MAEVNMDTSEDKTEETEVTHKTNMVFMISDLPKDQKVAIQEADVEQFIRQKLQDQGHTVLKVERGKKRYMIVFISIEVEDEERLPEIIKSLNAASGWECFKMARKNNPHVSNLVFCLDEIPEVEKQGLEDEKIVEFVVDKLKEGGHDVLNSRRGHKKFENMVFLCVKHEDDATLPDLVTDLNSKFWKGFEIARDWWREKKSKGPKTNMVFFISKIPEDVKKEMINDDSMLSMDFAKFVENKLVDKGLEVLKCNQGPQGPMKSSHIVFLNVKVENKEILPDLVDDLNKEFWGCFEVGNKKKGKIYCEVCDVALQNEHLMEDHKNGKAHLKKMKKVDENGVAKTFKCDICLVYTNNQNCLDAHIKGKNHQKKVSQSEQKSAVGGFSCELCGITATSNDNLNMHLLGAKHKKKLSAGTAKRKNNGGMEEYIKKEIKKIKQENGSKEVKVEIA